MGAGGFRHFVEKYLRAKSYCASPFETRQIGRQKQTVVVPGETIAADMVDRMPDGTRRQAYLVAASATTIELPPASLDGVFTDPPYFDNVQYAELMDFCFVWLRQGLGRDFEVFRRISTRTDEELTGNVTRGRDLEHFTEGLSRVFAHYAAALKERALFIFTYHHNDIQAYAPLVVAMLDAGLACTATLPAPAEMEASLHIARTASSTLDSVFVCRRVSLISEQWTPHRMHELLVADCRAMEMAGVIVSEGDVRCLALGHLARHVVNRLARQWESARPTITRLAEVRQTMTEVADEFEFQQVPGRILSTMKARSARQLSLLETPVA